ncbi:MAG TPA: hypothetical protein PLZ00_06105 [Mangrovimonas sp.]|nr:hypothetical protein [Mangrovimonas sp.]
MQVEAFKKKADEIIDKQPVEEKPSDELVEDSTVAKLFEEVKIMFQDLPDRIKKSSNYINPASRFRIHPVMLHEIMYISEKSEDNYIGFLMILSLFKNDMPWIYEIGIETYDSIKKAKTIQLKEKALHTYMRILKNSHRMRFSIAGQNENSGMYEELIYMTEKFLLRLIKNEK